MLRSRQLVFTLAAVAALGSAGFAYRVLRRPAVVPSIRHGLPEAAAVPFDQTAYRPKPSPPADYQKRFEEAKQARLREHQDAEMLKGLPPPRPTTPVTRPSGFPNLRIRKDPGGMRRPPTGFP